LNTGRDLIGFAVFKTVSEKQNVVSFAINLNRCIFVIGKSIIYKLRLTGNSDQLWYVNYP